MIILICGNYKTGKTVSAATFPKPMLFLDFDDGFLSVRTTKDKQGNPIVSDVGKIETIKMLKGSAPALAFDIDRKSAKTATYAKGALEVVNKYNEKVNEVQNGAIKVSTLVVDSLTSMFHIWKQAILEQNKQPILNIADYLWMEGILIGSFIPSLKTLPIDFVVLIDHEDIEKDELTGEIIEFPVGTSRSVGRSLGRHFDEVYRQVIDADKYVWRTRKAGRFYAGSRLGLPDFIPAHFNELKKYLPKAN